MGVWQADLTPLVKFMAFILSQMEAIRFGADTVIENKQWWLLRGEEDRNHDKQV